MSTPPASPEKKKRNIVASESSEGILKYMKRGGKAAQFERETMQADDFRRDWLVETSDIKEVRALQVRTATTLRQQRRRQRIYEEEIARGERSPRGAKRSRKVNLIFD
jgi:hypothetical protein